MPSTRKGFSQRVAGGGNALRMGTVIRLGIEGRADVAMMVSAIVSPGSDEGALYVLLTAHSPIRDYASDVRCSLIRGPGQSRLPLGTFVAPGSVLGSSAEKLGFHVLRLDETPLFGAATESACRLATTRNFRKVIWDAGTFKVRRLNAEEMPLDPVRLRQRRPYLDNRMGRVAGDIDDVEIRDVGRTLHYAYCGLVTRGRNRPLGDSASLGAPLLSRSGALSAIIVGAAENDTLVLPVEELRKEASLDFVTLGGDWPKVRVRPRAPSHDPAAAVRRRVSAPTPDRQPVLRRRFRAGDIAVDLGSTNTVIHVRGRGIVLNEPSVMAVETLDGVLKVRAVGDDAIVIAAQGTGSIELIRPLRNGVFAALDLAEEMIRQFVRKLGRENAFAVGRLRVVLAVPTGSSSSERHAIRDAAIRAGAGEIYLIDESIAAAIGAGMPIAEKRGSMVVDIGGGSTEVTILSSRGLAYNASIRVGGDKMDEAIVSYVRRNHALLIGEATAERIKQEVGCAKPPIDRIGAVIHIKGRDPVNGVPREAHISQGQVAEALSEPVGAIIEGVRLALENAAPEVAADIVDKGMVIMGGGALLKGLDEALRDETGLPVVVAAYPLMCVVSGAASAMDMNDIELTPLLA